jgi:hypothetical protein
MPQNEGTPGSDKVDTAIPIHIGNARSIRFGNEGGRPAHRAEGPHWRIHPSGHERTGLFEERFTVGHGKPLIKITNYELRITN